MAAELMPPGVGATNPRMRDAASGCRAPPGEKGLMVPKSYPTFSVPRDTDTVFMGRTFDDEQSRPKSD
jgi:hypothetical protein